MLFRSAMKSHIIGGVEHHYFVDPRRKMTQSDGIGEGERHRQQDVNTRCLHLNLQSVQFTSRCCTLILTLRLVEAVSRGEHDGASAIVIPLLEDDAISVQPPSLSTGVKEVRDGQVQS